jgi:hypothetical protein
MRRTLICLLVAGAILVAGCGGDDDDDSGTGGGNSDDTSSGDASVDSFCEDFRSYDEQFSEQNEPSDEEVIEAIRSLDPPEEIADDFDTLIAGLDRLQSIDTNDPAAQEELQEEMSQYTEASTNIQTFVDENCGETSVDDGSDDTSDATTEDSGSGSAETTETTAG